MADKGEPKSGNVAVPATDTAATTQAAEEKKKMDEQARIRELLAKKKAERAAAAAAEAVAADANKPQPNTDDKETAEKKAETSSAADNNTADSPPKNGVDDEARLREMLSKKKIMHKKNRRASKSEDPTAGKNEGNDGDKKSPHHPNGHRRHENNDGRGVGRDYRRDRPHHGRGGYYDDRRRDDRSGWRNNNDRGGGYGRGRDNYWDGRGRGGGWRDDRRDYGGRGGYQQNEREPPTNDRSRGRSRSRSFSRSSSGSRSRSYSSSAGSRSSGSYSSRSHSRSYSRSVSRSPSRDSHYSETQDQKRKRSDSANSAGNEKKKHRRSHSNSSKSKSDADALTKDQRTILVSQLVMKADDYDIRRYFKRKVGVKVNDVILLRDKRTGRHKGIAYVELGSLEDVDTALEVSGKTPDFQRFPILVKRTEAEKNVAGISVATSSDSPFQLTADGKRIEAQKVYVGSIDRAVTQAQLYSLFSQFGKLDNVLLQMDMATGISKGFAFLSYPDPKDANLAIQTMSGQMLAGRPLKTGWANQQSMAAGVQEVRSDEFPTDSNEKIEKVNQVLIQLTGSGLTTMLSHVDPAQQQALLAAGPAGALGILPSAQLVSVADAALDVALGNIPTGGAGAVSPVPVNVAAAAAAAPIMESPIVVAPEQSPVIATAPAASTPPSNVDDAKVIGRIDRPSNHILVHNMFDKDEETDPGWEEDIRLDFEEECAQYGKISSVVVMSKEAGGKIYATFDGVDGAMSCAKNLAGRWFDKRQLRVEFVDSIPS